MSRSIVIRLNNNGDLNECFFYNGKNYISLNNYLIKANRILNSFENVKYTKEGFNEFVITDKKVINAFYSKIPNLNKSKDNALKKVIIASSLLGMLASFKIIDKTDNKTKEEAKPISYTIHPNIIKDEKEDNEDISFNFDFLSYDVKEDIEPLYSNEELEIINSENKDNEEDFLYDDDTPVFSFDYEDRSETEKSNYAKTNYEESVNKYSKIYGIDKNLIMAILTQENAFNEVNNSNIGANGVMQIESIWYGYDITAYNFETNNTDTVTINKESLIDPDYSIKIGTMILNNYYYTLYNNYVEKGILDKSNAILATILSYNKGITAICNLINNYGNDFINHISETLGGDNDYLKHVCSYLKDQSIISIQNINNDSSQIVIDNLTR